MDVKKPTGPARSGGPIKNGLAIALLLMMGLTLLMAYQNSTGSNEDPSEVPISTILREIPEGKIVKVVITSDSSSVIVATIEGKSQTAITSEQAVGTLVEAVNSYNLANPSREIALEFQKPKDNTEGLIFSVLLSLLPVLLIGGFFIFMMRSASGSNNQAMSFGKSPAKRIGWEKSFTKFSDVAGEDEAKQELQEAVEFLMHPIKFTSLGAKLPRGVLLIGPPGCGKTLLAKAVAGEAGANFFEISGSSFVEMFVGVGASRVRDLFETAKRNAPSVIFIDEIDAVGRQRGSGIGGSHDEREQTLNQILVEMDGFHTSNNVIVIAATNRPDVLDTALVRSGRFDRKVVVDFPDVKGRREILEVHSKGKPMGQDVDLLRLAKISQGLSGADLANILNEAAILAARQSKQAIDQKDIEASLEKVIMGPERRSRVVSKRDQTIIAYHEAGHAIVGASLEKCDPIHKVSIVARGMAGGVTWSLPEGDDRLRSRKFFEDSIAQALGGFVAETMLMTDDVTTGASSDLEKATEMAHDMVTRYGMSEKLGPRTFGQPNKQVFLGRQFSQDIDYSPVTGREIDEEVKAIVGRAKERATQVLTDKKDILERVVRALLIKETLDGEEFMMIYSGKPIPEAPTQ